MMSAEEELESLGAKIAEEELKVADKEKVAASREKLKLLRDRKRELQGRCRGAKVGISARSILKAVKAVNNQLAEWGSNVNKQYEGELTDAAGKQKFYKEQKQEVEKVSGFEVPESLGFDLSKGFAFESGKGDCCVQGKKEKQKCCEVKSKSD